MKRIKEKHSRPGRKSFRAESVLTVILVLLLSFAAIASGIAMPGLAVELQSRKIEKTFKTVDISPDMLQLEGGGELYAELPEQPAEQRTPTAEGRG